MVRLDRLVAAQRREQVHRLAAQRRIGVAKRQLAGPVSVLGRGGERVLGGAADRRVGVVALGVGEDVDRPVALG